jgi:hypothetical protein
VEKALKAANIPLLRIRATREYDPHEVLHQIRLVLASSEEPVQEWFAEYGEEDEPWWHSILSRVPSLGRWTSELRGAVRRA